MPEPDIQTLLSQLQATANQPLYRSPTQQLGGILSGAASGYKGQANPVIDQLQQQRESQLRQQIEMIKLQHSVQRLRMDKMRLQFDIAKGLPDDNPDAMRKKLEIYNQSGLVKYSPDEIEKLVTSEQAKKIPGRLGAVIGALDSGMDLNTLPPSLTSGIDVKMLQSLPKSVRQSIDPEGRKRLAEALKADLTAESEKLKLDREQRLIEGKAHPLDLIAEGAKTPEDLGARLVANALASGVPIAPEYRPLVEAYHRKQAETGVTKEVLAVRAALGDPIAAKALDTIQRTEEGKKLVGESPRAYLSPQGHEAPANLSTKEATRQGYFLASPREEASVTGYPRAMQLLNNLSDTMREVRDFGGFRTKSGVAGALQRYVTIPATRALGDPLKLSAKLTLLNSQRGELIQALRFLDEKGNIAAKIWIPQLEGMSPEAGMYASYELLTKLEKQINSGIRQTRLSGMAGTVPSLPVMLLSNSKEYQQLIMKGWTDAAIETGQGAPDGKPITINGRPVIVIK